MINFKMLESRKEELRLEFLIAKPFQHLVIDNFCDEQELENLLSSLPEITTKSRDYVFASNKFEKSKFRNISSSTDSLYQDLTSDRFAKWLQFISNEDVFIDKDFHGGGIHQGKKGSFLDMHIDFNYHPLHQNWYRTLNLLLYLNKNWLADHGGQLKLQDLRNGKQKSIGIPFNRMVIQLTGKHTLHGYDKTNFPDGRFRTSIAAYAYTIHNQSLEKRRTTDWHVGDDQHLKKMLAWIYDPAVKIKNIVFGSSTAKH